MKAKLANKRASGSGELREEARAAKHQTAKQAHSKQPGSLKLLHLMRSSDPEKKPDFILLIPGSQGASPTHSFSRGAELIFEKLIFVYLFLPSAVVLQGIHEWRQYMILFSHPT